MSLNLDKFFLKEAQDLNFFQAIYLTERLKARPGQIGTGDDLQSEAIRIEVSNSISFPAAEIANLKLPANFEAQADELELNKAMKPGEGHNTFQEWLDSPEGPLRMAVTFMGLYGVSSPLPSYFVDPITLHKREYFELKKFLDMFGHRLHSLFYRSWKKYRHYVEFKADGSDPYTQCLLALTGQWVLPRKSDGSEEIKPDLQRLPYGRFLGHRVRSAQSLKQLLQDYFGFPRVEVVQFRGVWVEIPAKTYLGVTRNKLGETVLLGEKMRDDASRFEIIIGPLPQNKFTRFVTHSSEERSEIEKKVRALIDDFLLDSLDYQIRILLDTEGIESPSLGNVESRLGCTWLGENAREAISIACNA